MGGLVNMYRKKGFTMTELMITVVIIGILTAVAVPNIGSWIQKQKLSSNTQRIVDGLYFARGEALKRRNTVIVDFQTDASSTRTNANTMIVKSSSSELLDIDLDDPFYVNTSFRSASTTYRTTTGFSNRGQSIFSYTGTIVIQSPTTKKKKTISILTGGTITIN